MIKVFGCIEIVWYFWVDHSRFTTSLNLNLEEPYITLSYDVASESVIKPCIKTILHCWVKYANYLVTLCVDVHKNVAFSYGEILTF